MLIKKAPPEFKFTEITDKGLFLNRRTFVRGAILAASATATGLLYRELNPPPPARKQEARKIENVQRDALASGTLGAADKPTSFQDITNYNNFYEFSTSKGSVARAARAFVTRPWTVSVEGLVNRPRTYDIDELLRISPPEERVYRHRCVEGWSMVIPWVGFPLYKLLNQVEPLSSARYVAFQTLYDPKQMTNQRTSVLRWPYVEGLRLDEAMHPLTILASGLYGEELPNQDGAPLKLVVPWKYGFKGIKSIVKIKLVEQQPPATWNLEAPDEYGFYSNVNPNVDHPRWSQATEHRIGEFWPRNTLMFNGYGDQVAQLYSGMDLRTYF